MCDDYYDFGDRASELEIILDEAYEWTKELLAVRGEVQFETPPWLQRAHDVLNEGMHHVVTSGPSTVRDAARQSREIAEASRAHPGSEAAP